jgi:cell division protein FtsQ
VPLPRLRPDPAPSRLTYRAQRLWLTPLFRALLRIGLPAFVVIASLLWYATDEQKVQALMDQVAEIRREIEDRPEFRINILSIEGAGPVVTEEVRATLALDLPVSSFDLDLTDLRARVEALPAVASASVRNAGSGTLSVEMTERVPALIWQSRAGTVLIDADGNFVAALATRPPDAPLPMIAGGRGPRRWTRRWPLRGCASAGRAFARPRPRGRTPLGRGPARRPPHPFARRGAARGARPGASPA